MSKLVVENNAQNILKLLNNMRIGIFPVPFAVIFRVSFQDKSYIASLKIDYGYFDTHNTTMT